MLDIYRKIVVDANKKMNLVSRRNVENLLKSLIDESLLPLKWDVCHLRSPLIDIGSGAGIPGIPLKIEKPELALTLLDANRRKSLFLRRVIEQLSLDDVEVVWERAENICSDSAYRERFGTLTSRAVCSMKDLMIWGGLLLKLGGELIVWKGSSVDVEMAELDTDGWDGPDFLRQPSGLTLIRFVKS